MTHIDLRAARCASSADWSAAGVASQGRRRERQESWPLQRQEEITSTFCPHIHSKLNRAHTQVLEAD